MKSRVEEPERLGWREWGGAYLVQEKVRKGDRERERASRAAELLRAEKLSARLFVIAACSTDKKREGGVWSCCV